MISIMLLLIKVIVAPLNIYSRVSGRGISHSLPTMIAYIMGGAAAFGTITVTARI